MSSRRASRAAVERALRLGAHDERLLEVEADDLGSPTSGHVRRPVLSVPPGVSVFGLLVLISLVGAFGLRADVRRGSDVGVASTLVGGHRYAMRVSLEDWRSVLGPSSAVNGLALCIEQLPATAPSPQRACSSAVGEQPTPDGELTIGFDSWFHDATGCAEHRVTGRAGPNVSRVVGVMASGSPFEAGTVRGPRAAGLFLVVEPRDQEVLRFWGVDAGGVRVTPTYRRDALPYERRCATAPSAGEG